MREVVEAAQRLELDYACCFVHRDKADPLFRREHLWGGYVKETTPEERVAQLRVALNSEYDLIVIGALNWKGLPTFAKYEILKQVKGGAGLIKVATGPYGAAADEFLGLATKKKTVPPLSLAAGIPWKALPVFTRYKDTRGFLHSTIRVSQLGKGKIVKIVGYIVPELQLIAPGFTRSPLTLNWCRTVAESHESKNPEFSMPMTGVKRLDYDYYWAFLIRLFLYAADKLPDVTVAEEGLVTVLDRDAFRDVVFSVERAPGGDVPDSVTAGFVLRDRDNNVIASSTAQDLHLKVGGNRVAFPVSSIPSGHYFADLWIRRGEKVFGFGSKALLVRGRTSITSLDLTRTHFGVHDQVSGQVKMDAGGASLSGVRLLLRQRDNLNRVTRERSHDVSDTTVAFSFEPVEGPLTVYQYVEAELTVDGVVVDRKKTAFTLSDLYLNDTIRFSTWQAPLNSFVSMHLHDRLRNLGFDSTCHVRSSDAHRYSDFGLGTTMHNRGRFEIPVLSNLRNTVCVRRFRDMACYGAKNFRSYPRDPDDKPLEVVDGVRLPCLNDPAFRTRLKARLADFVGYFGTMSSSEYVFGDEMRFAHKGRSDFELCFSPWCKQYFRDYLKRQYGTIQALNEEYGTEHKDFSSIEPVKLADVLETPALSPQWADFRMAMEHSYNGIFEMCRAAILADQPEAKVGYLCSFGGQFNSYSGNEMWQASRWADVFQRYEEIIGSKAAIDFARPGSLVQAGLFWGYVPSWSTEFTTMILWDHLFRGANLFMTYNSDVGSLLAYDLSIYDDFKPILEQYREIKGGIGKLIHEAERDTGAIALLYSVPSIHHWTLTNQRLKSRSMQRNYNAWASMLTDNNSAFRVISDQQLRDGMLHKEQFRMLVLPWSRALSREEIARVKTFAENGGIVLADIRPGVSDAHCKPYKASPMDELFGVTQNTGRIEMEETLVSVPFTDKASPKPLGLMQTDVSLRLTTGKASGVTENGAPVLISHAYAQGKGILLNFSLDQYVDIRDLIVGMRIPFVRSTHAPRFLKFLATTLRDNGLENPIPCAPELPDLRRFRFTSGSIEYLGLMQELPESVYAYAGDTARPLTAKKTEIRLPGKAHTYDARAGNYLGFSDRISAFITPGHARLLALLPYRVAGISIEAPATVSQGASLGFGVTISADSEPGKHVLNITVTDPGGRRLRHYDRNVSCRGGHYRGDLHLALNEAPGAYTLRVRDAATGESDALAFKVTAVEAEK